MTKKKDAKPSIMVGKIKLYNSATQEAIIITDEEMVNYDVRLWQVVK
jgi:hypothetical protein